MKTDFGKKAGEDKECPQSSAVLIRFEPFKPYTDVERRGETSMNVCKTELLRKSACGLFVMSALTVGASSVSAQAPGGDYIDPQTGDIFRQVTRRVTRPVVEERVERQERTVFVPETVKETRPEYRTTYLPVTQMKWMPYVEGRWNPFRQPRVAYRQVPETHWEARSEVVNRTTMQTRWIAEKRTVEIPHRIVRYETSNQTNMQFVGRRMPRPQLGANLDPKVAARLRPLAEAAATSIAAQPSAASNTVGRATSDPPRRSSMQAGMRTNVLQPAGSLGTPLPPGTTGEAIATVPSFSVYR